MPYTYNENPQGATYFIVCSVFQGITLLTITLRLWSRYIQRTALQLNDYAILAALVSRDLRRESRKTFEGSEADAYS